MTPEQYATRRAALTTAIADKRRDFDRAALTDLSAPSGKPRTATTLRGELVALESEMEELDAAHRATTAIAVEQSAAGLARQWQQANDAVLADLEEMNTASREIEAAITELGDRIAGFYAVSRRWKLPLTRLADPRQRDLLSGLTILDPGEILAALDTIRWRMDGKEGGPLTIADRVTNRSAAARETIRGRILPHIATEVEV